MLPFASIVAEEFGNWFPQFRPPVVGSGGTGGGFRQSARVWATADNLHDVRALIDRGRLTARIVKK